MVKYENLPLLPLLSVQFSSVKHIHIVVSTPVLLNLSVVLRNDDYHKILMGQTLTQHKIVVNCLLSDAIS